MNAAEKKGLSALEHVAVKAMNELIELDADAMDRVEIREHVAALRAVSELVLRALEMRLPEPIVEKKDESQIATPPTLSVVSTPIVKRKKVPQRGGYANISDATIAIYCKSVELNGWCISRAAALLKFEQQNLRNILNARATEEWLEVYHEHVRNAHSERGRIQAQKLKILREQKEQSRRGAVASSPGS